MKRSLTILVLLCAVVLMTTAAWGQLSWRTDGISGIWTGTNWSASPSATGGTAYTANTDAIFSANSTVTFATVSIGNVTVNDGVTVTISNAGTLSMAGPVQLLILVIVPRLRGLVNQ